MHAILTRCLCPGHWVPHESIQGPSTGKSGPKCYATWLRGLCYIIGTRFYIRRCQPAHPGRDKYHRSRLAAAVLVARPSSHSCYCLQLHCGYRPMEPISLKYPSAKDPPESFTYCQEDGTTVELPVYIHPQTGKDVVKCILCKPLVRGSYFDRHFNSNTK